MSPRLLGLVAALAAFAIDQVHKTWMLDVFDIEARRRVVVTPFLDLVIAWNPGVSYSLLRADSPLGRAALIALTGAATLALAVWLWRAPSRLTAGALGLIIGGALGNLADRLTHGAVADFFLFHVGDFSWYVFNIADIAITAGVALLLLDQAIAPKPVAAR